MRILLMLFLVSILVYVIKKPQYSITAFGIVLSTSPMWRLGLAETELYLFYMLLFVLVIYKVCIQKKKLRIVLLFAAFMAFFQILVTLAINAESNVLILSLFQFVVIPVIILCSMQLVQLKHTSFSHVYLPYFVVNLAIFYIRAFISYDFFGVSLVYNYDVWEQIYVMGGAAYRPSNLNSPIIFAIELAVYLGICLYENGFSKRNKILFAASTIPLLLMRSRSAFILIIFVIIGYLIKPKNKYALPISLVALSAIIFGVMGLEDLISFGNRSTINFRLNSALYTLREFWSLDFSRMLLGNGVGSANYLAEGAASFSFYSENYFVAKLVDTGIVGLLLFIWLITVVLLRAKSTSMKYLFIGFLGVNFLASNLTGYTVKLMFWVMIYIMWHNTLRRSGVNNAT